MTVGKVILFVGIKTTLKDLFEACIPFHPLELYHLFKEGRFTFLKMDENEHVLKALDTKLRTHDSKEFILRDVLTTLEYLKKLKDTIDGKSLESPMAIADQVICEYKPTTYYSGEERFGLETLKFGEMEDALELFANKIGLKNGLLGVFIKST